MLKIKILTWICLCLGVFTFAQIDRYNYKRNIDGVSDTWHSITLPNGVFGKVQSSLADIRIYGVSKKNDTIEAPYILKTNAEEVVNSKIPFDIINSTKTAKGYYFTFKLNSEETINQIRLDFNNSNFDWQVDLQGSQNQQEWFTVLENYRILSINNENTDYSFTKLAFPDAKYSYFRILVKTDTKPELLTASIFNQIITAGSYSAHKVIKTESSENKIKKTTDITVELEAPVSINNLKINIESDIDYYRFVTIDYLVDSLNTEKGWKYRYKNLASGTLNSLEENSFKFSSTITKQLKITIKNNDNEPVNVNSVSVKGDTYKLITRFSNPASYMLVYGNETASKPRYDIDKFSTSIPNEIKSLTLGNEEIIKKIEQPKVAALFENQYWLWGIIIVIIVLLGGFTLKMMQKR